nr:sulfatase-like hydrolase/transferase [Myxococcota bacterium]
MTSIFRLSVLRVVAASLIFLGIFPASGLARERKSASQVELSKIPANAPNIVVVLLDDVGFSGPATFGGAIPTPTLDDLSGVGLRFNR